MDERRHNQGRRRRVWFSPYLLALVLSPVLLQTSTPLSCRLPGDTTLSALEFKVLGEDQIVFDSAQRTYDVWLPTSGDVATVRATSTDPGAQASYTLQTSRGLINAGDIGVGGGEISVGLPLDPSWLKILVEAPEGARGRYRVQIWRGCSDCDDGNECTADTCDPVVEQCVHTLVPDGTSCDFDGLAGICVGGTCGPSVFPCTEQGILDAIALGGGPYTFACNGPTTVATQAEIVIDNDVILDGEGNLTVDGNYDHRVFSVPSGVTADLVGMTVSGGLANSGEQGAGIRNEGTLRIADSSLTSNGAGADDGGPAIEGGAVYNGGTLTLESSIVQGNDCYTGCGIHNAGTATLNNSEVFQNGGQWGGASNVNAGSGIYNDGGTLTLVDTTVSLNEDGNGDAGAIDIFGGTLLLINSVVSDNYSIQSASIQGRGSTTLINSTISGNATEGLFSGVELWDGSLTLISSTVLDPIGDYYLSSVEFMVTNSIINGCSFLESLVTSGGGNIESGGDTCGLSDATDMVNVSVGLGPLADNGGPTQTHALLPGSVAIDRIPAAMCVDAVGQPLTTDQRGEPRPETGGTMCDVGAFEVQP